MLRLPLTDQIEVCGLYPLSDMPSIYKASDCLLATLKATPAFEKTIPAKIQSYMLSSKPILTMISGEGSDVVDESRCGLTARSGDFLSLTNNIQTLIALTKEDRQNMGSNGRNYAQTEFNREILIDKLESWFKEFQTI